MESLGLPEIPRLYIACAQWGACLAYILSKPKKISNKKFYKIGTFMLILLCGYHVGAGFLPLQLWLLGMSGGVFLMYLFIRMTTNLNRVAVGYYTAFAFASAELVEAIEWWQNMYLTQFVGYNKNIFNMFSIFIIYGGSFLLIGKWESKYSDVVIDQKVNKRQMWGTICTVMIAFLMSNISFVFPNTPFSARQGQEVFYIRMLVALCAMVMIYVQKYLHYQMHVSNELERMEEKLKTQYNHYQFTKETIELVNIKYHDLRHQIGLIRAATSMESRTKYIDELEKEIQGYAAIPNTGNGVLDSILSEKSLICQRYGINITYVVDGSLLSFMSDLDVCSLFGNALENAIEGTKQIRDIDKRLIRMEVFQKNSFLFIKIENYFEKPLRYEGNEIVTTKEESSCHGYGIKSLKYTIDRYRGTMTIRSDGNWFKIACLIPK